MCLTTSGKTANIISSYRPKARIIAVTDRMDVLNTLELTWGIQTLTIKSYKTMEDILDQVDTLLVTNGLAKTGDRVIFTLGQPISDGAKINALFLHIVGAENQTRAKDNELPLRCQVDPSIA